MIQPKYKIIYKQDTVKRTEWAVVRNNLDEEEIQMWNTLGIKRTMLYTGSYQQCLNWINS